MNTEEMINKSLDEIDELVKSMEQNDQELNKPDVASQEISEDTPSQGEEGGEEPTEEPMGDEEGGEEPTEEDDTDEVPDEDMGKSLAEELTENDDVRKALEVSDFLDALVKGISERLLAHDENIVKSLKGTDKSNELLAKSFQGIVNTQKAVIQSQAKLSKSIATLTERLNKVEHEPVVRKSVSTTKEHVIEKSFAGNSTVGKKDNTLSKSEAVEILTNECNTRPELVQDVLALEATGDFNAISSLAKSILNK